MRFSLGHLFHSLNFHWSRCCWHQCHHFCFKPHSQITYCLLNHLNLVFHKHLHWPNPPPQICSSIVISGITVHPSHLSQTGSHLTLIHCLHIQSVPHTVLSLQALLCQSPLLCAPSCSMILIISSLVPLVWSLCPECWFGLVCFVLFWWTKPFWSLAFPHSSH